MIKFLLIQYSRYISGKACDSPDLVPGDIVNLSTSRITTIPADLFLLSGDAIINESMLTGESVPVNKVQAKDEDFIKWRDEKSENPKTFLYCGTKVVRVRGSVYGVGQERPALGLVVRTGRNTSFPRLLERNQIITSRF